MRTSQCLFLVEETAVLGHIINKDTVRPNNLNKLDGVKVFNSYRQKVLLV